MSENFDSKIIEDIFVIDSENIYESQIVQQCFDIVGVFVAAVDLKGNITLINRNGRELLDYKENGIVGENFIENFIIKEKQKKVQELFFQTRWAPEVIIDQAVLIRIQSLNKQVT